MKKVFSILTILTVFLSPLYSVHQMQTFPIQEVLECVDYVEENRVFIKPEKVVFMSQGTGLTIDGKVILMPEMQKRGGDFFIEYDFARDEISQEAPHPKTCRVKPILPKGKCPYCNTDTTAWGDCWNPDCEYYGKRVI